MIKTDIKGVTVCMKCGFYENGKSFCNKEQKNKTFKNLEEINVDFCCSC